MVLVCQAGHEPNAQCANHDRSDRSTNLTEPRLVLQLITSYTSSSDNVSSRSRVPTYGSALLHAKYKFDGPIFNEATLSPLLVKWVVQYPAGIVTLDLAERELSVWKHECKPGRNECHSVAVARTIVLPG